MDGPARMGHQTIQGAVRVAEDACCIGVVLHRGVAQCTPGLIQPLPLHQAAHLPLRGTNRRQQRRHLAGQAPLPQPRRQLQHRALMPHHLGQAGGTGPLHRKHGAVRLTHRRQLGGVADEHQTGLERMGALEGNAQQGAVDH